jgi:hypothetical protein
MLPMPRFSKQVCAALALSFSACAMAADPPLDAAASDPARLGWMVGAPPPPERRLRFDDGSYFRFPALRWSVAHHAHRQCLARPGCPRAAAARAARRH